MASRTFATADELLRSFNPDYENCACAEPAEEASSLVSEDLLHAFESEVRGAKALSEVRRQDPQAS